MAVEISGQRLPFWMLFWAYHGRGRDICTKFGTGVTRCSAIAEHCRVRYSFRQK